MWLKVLCFDLLFDLILYAPVNAGTGLLGTGINASCSKTLHSDAGEAGTHDPSVLSQALYSWFYVWLENSYPFILPD